MLSAISLHDNSESSVLCMACKLYIAPRAIFGCDKYERVIRNGDRVRCGCGHPNNCVVGLPERVHTDGMVCTCIHDGWLYSAKDGLLPPDRAERVLVEETYALYAPISLNQLFLAPIEPLPVRPADSAEYVGFVESMVRMRDAWCPKAEIYCDHTISGFVAFVRWRELSGVARSTEQLATLLRSWSRKVGLLELLSE